MFSPGFILAILGVAIFFIVCMWNIFEKAGQPGWACIIPFYSTIIELRIVNKPWWWLLLGMIPYVGLIWAIWTLNLLCKSFGKSTGFTIGCLFLPFIFFPILAFSKNAVFIGNGKNNDPIYDQLEQ